jgi:purine-binding chemotaxis protein CheW
MDYGELARNADADALEVISFNVNGQPYCLDISDIIEIRGWTPATPIAQAPHYVKGVISLRGVVMPVIDLGARIGMHGMDPNDRNVIIVAQLDSGPVGLLVEAVSDTMMINKAQIQPADTASGGAAPEFVIGFLPLEGRMVTVLRLDLLIGRTGARSASFADGF